MSLSIYDKTFGIPEIFALEPPIEIRYENFFFRTREEFERDFQDCPQDPEFQKENESIIKEMKYDNENPIYKTGPEKYSCQG